MRPISGIASVVVTRGKLSDVRTNARGTGRWKALVGFLRELYGRSTERDVDDGVFTMVNIIFTFGSPTGVVVDILAPLLLPNSSSPCQASLLSSGIERMSENPSPAPLSDTAQVVADSKLSPGDEYEEIREQVRRTLNYSS